PAAGLIVVVTLARNANPIPAPAVRGKCAGKLNNVMTGKAQLLEVVRTLGTSRCLADFLHGGHEERDQDSNDGNDHKQLDEREPDPRRSPPPDPLLDTCTKCD